ncbi:MAG: helix-turn-helix transcriptional regulator [Bacilli bacterium]
MIDYQKAVKDLRDKLIMTQAEFSKMLGVSFTSINRWENGLNRPTTTARKQIVELCKENNIELKEVKE